MSPAPPSTATRRAHLRRLVALVAVGALASIAATCQSAKPPAPPPPPPPPSAYCHPPGPPTSAAGYQAAFDGLRAANTAHWVATDGGFPVNIDNERVLWLFGDTLLGAPPNGPLKSHILVNNGFVLQDGACFTPITEPIPDPPAPNEFVWPTDAIVDGNVLRVFGLHMRKIGPGPLDLELVRVTVTDFSLPGLTRQPVRTLPLPITPSYGETVTVINDDTETWVYAYGQTRRPGPAPAPFDFPIANHYVARARIGEILDADAWEFWRDDPLLPNDLPPPASDGIWVEDKDDALPLLFNEDPENLTDILPVDPDEAPAAAFPVAELSPGTSYLGSAFRFDLASDKIDTWEGPTPQGPWTKRATPAANVSNTVEPNGRFAYGGRVVFDVPVPGSRIALWSTNALPFEAVLANPNLYKVWFAQPAPGSIP